ncbi:hypothetical protein A7K50_00255 [Dehalobacter sp. MCB1]|nr:hypothetical protein A7K50_00255 [Dehalobacter sp. MCB1]TCX50665.1 hypothetical protein C1I36_08560 [Dehalobacter sp. 14DCB1]TCX52425.1 hypothetical protein C1I38_09150 [Dehalobacter sp. 12DCB1]
MICFGTFETFLSKTLYQVKQLNARQIWGIFIALIAIFIGFYFCEELFLGNLVGINTDHLGVFAQILQAPVFQGMRIVLYILLWLLMIKLPFLSFKTIGVKTPYGELSMEAILSESSVIKNAMLNEISVALMGILRILNNASVIEMIKDIKNIGKEINDPYFIKSITKVINIQFKLYNIRKTHSDYLIVSEEIASYKKVPIVNRATLKELAQESIINKDFRISDDASIMVVPLFFKSEVCAIIYVQSEKYLFQQIDAMIIDSIWNNICHNNEALKELIINRELNL